MKCKSKFLIFILIFFLLVGLGITEEKKKKNVKDIEEVSLDVLLNQEVVVASKKSQKVEEAPAIISVVTKREIEERGYLNLYDALTSLPGINSIETYFGFNQLFFRGIYSPLYNNKSLVLINGHPFWDSVNGSYYIEAFPIEAVKRIEVIRGPGSTLYGTNAFSGVINIVTEDGSKNGYSGYVRGTSYNTFETSALVSGSSNDLKYLVSTGGRFGEGYPYTIPKEEFGKQNVETDYVLNYSSVFALIDYKGLKFSTYSFYEEKSKIDIIPAVFGSLSETHNKWLATFFMLNYSNNIGKKLSYNLRASYNYFDRQFLSASGNFTDHWSKGKRYDSEITLNYEPNKKINFMLGAGYEYCLEDYFDIYSRNNMNVIKSTIPEHDLGDSTYFTYLQVDFPIGKRIGAITGLRYVYNKDYDSFLTPRGGFVFKLSDGLFIKTLYGEAFRAPNLFEKYADLKGVVVGNKELQPEKIKTMDIGLDWVMKSKNLRVNYFYTIVSNLIGRFFNQDLGQTQYTNFEGESKYTGVEFELRGRLIGKSTFFLNGSYINGKDSSGKTIEYIPNYLSYGGITYNSKKFLASVYYKYISSVVNPTIDGNVKIDPAFILDTKVGLKFNDIVLSIIVHNLFDKEIWAPEFIRKKIGMLQNGPGRMIYLELRKGF